MPAKTVAETFALTIVLFVCGASTLAQSPVSTTTQPAISAEKKTAIAELLEVMEAKKTALAIFNSVVQAQEKDSPEMVWQAMSGFKEVQSLTPEQQADLKAELFNDSARRNKRIRELFTQKIDLPGLMDDIAYRLYDKYFTEGEIKDMVTFYKSPTGKKSIAVLPNLVTESLSSTMTALKPKMDEIISELMEEEITRARKELEEKKANKASQSPEAKPQ